LKSTNNNVIYFAMLSTGMLEKSIPLKTLVLWAGQFGTKVTRVGHLNTMLAQGGRNLNESVFKSSNACRAAHSGEARVYNIYSVYVPRRRYTKSFEAVCQAAAEEPMP